MTNEINEQYNYAPPESLSIKIATAVRKRMFAIFMSDFQPKEMDLVLDIGVTGDRTYSSSNYFEMLYPYKHRITAAGLDNAVFLEKEYPGVTFQYANALSLPFKDSCMDYVHSSAVWEHVGNEENQRKMLSECFRVARKGIFLTTPNRWFPVEFHTQVPLLHWLPKNIFRSILKRTKYVELADEANLNLLTSSEIKRFLQQHSDWNANVKHTKLLGWPSNILLSAKKRNQR